MYSYTGDYASHVQLLLVRKYYTELTVMIMKLLVVVSALFAIVNAGPVKESWTARTAIQPAVIRKTVGEIWTDCSKLNTTI